MKALFLLLGLALLASNCADAGYQFSITPELCTFKYTTLPNLTVVTKNLNDRLVGPAGIVPGHSKQLLLTGTTLLPLPANYFVAPGPPLEFNNLKLEGLSWTTIRNSSFVGLARTNNVLITGNNVLILIEGGAFAGLHSLLGLVIERCLKLGNIPNNPFANLRILRSLHITRLPALRDMPRLAGLHNLQFLKVERCGITELPRGVFYGLRKLDFISIRFNKQLTVLRSRMLEGAVGYIRFLKLWGNGINTIENGAFNGSTNQILALNLGRNKLTTLTKAMFGQMRGNVRSLKVHVNRLTHVDEDLFPADQEVLYRLLVHKNTGPIIMAVPIAVCRYQKLYKGKAFKYDTNTVFTNAPDGNPARLCYYYRIGDEFGSG